MHPPRGRRRRAHSRCFSGSARSTARFLFFSGRRQPPRAVHGLKPGLDTTSALRQTQPAAIPAKLTDSAPGNPPGAVGVTARSPACENRLRCPLDKAALALK